MTGIMSIAQIRGQLEIANSFAKAGIDFVVVPISTEDERVSLAKQALNKIEELQSRKDERRD